MARERIRDRPRPAIASKEKAPLVERAFKTRKKLSVDEQRWIKLSYQLIEYRIMYYYPHLIREVYHEGLTIHDSIYDQYEIEYLELCDKLKVKNTVVHCRYEKYEHLGPGMMEVDFRRPVVHLIMRKYGEPNWQELYFGEDSLPEEEQEEKPVARAARDRPKRKR